MAGQYSSSYGSSGYGSGCCCCDDGAGGILDNQNLLGLLAAGAAAVALLFTAITMAMTTRRRKRSSEVEGRLEPVSLNDVAMDVLTQGKAVFICGVSTLNKSSEKPDKNRFDSEFPSHGTRFSSPCQKTLEFKTIRI